MPGHARTWTGQQLAAIERVEAWLRRGGDGVFKLFGYAGTGKTELLKRIKGAEARSGDCLHRHKRRGHFGHQDL
jgi:ABC-type molybdate transport system ATPase subunit